jgi:hypothetical protein
MNALFASRRIDEKENTKQKQNTLSMISRAVFVELVDIQVNSVTCAELPAQTE